MKAQIADCTVVSSIKLDELVAAQVQILTAPSSPNAQMSWEL